MLRKPRGEPSLLELSRGVASNRRSQLRVYNLTQRHKGTKFVLDTKTTSDLKVATKPCGRGSPQPHNPPRGTCIAADNSVSSVKAALAALCIFRTRKKSQCLCVSVFKKTPCGRKLCGLCKVALAALCIFRYRKRHSLFVSLCSNRIKS